MENAPVVSAENAMTLLLPVTDALVKRYLAGFPEEVRQSKALEALKVGVIAIGSASPSLDARVVEEAFRDVEQRVGENIESFQRDLKDRLEGYFRTENGTVPLFVEKHFGPEGRVSRTLEAYFDEEKGRLAGILEGRVGPESFLGKAMDPTNRDGLLSRVETAVEEIIREGSGRVLSAFSLDEETSAISRLKRSLREEVEALQKVTREQHAELMELLGQKKGQAAESVRGTGKGMDFEETLYEYVAELAVRLEDLPEHVSGQKGCEGNCKVGDYTITLGGTSGAPGEVIVIEAKKAGNYKLKKALDELDLAKKNRKASIGIFVFAKGYEPAEVGDFYRRGNDFIVTVDEERLENGEELLFLDSACKVARTLIVTRLREEEEASVDLGFVHAELESITALMDSASEIKTKVSTIRNSADFIDKTLNNVTDQIEIHLENLRRHLPK